MEFMRELDEHAMVECNKCYHRGSLCRFEIIITSDAIERSSAKVDTTLFWEIEKL